MFLKIYMDDRHMEGENQAHRNLPKKIGTGPSFVSWCSNQKL